MSLFKNAKRALLLTGTPALSRPVEIYSQVHCLRPAVFSNFNDFAQRYCNPKKVTRLISFPELKVTPLYKNKYKYNIKFRIVGVGIIVDRQIWKN